MGPRGRRSSPRRRPSARRRCATPPPAGSRTATPCAPPPPPAPRSSRRRGTPGGNRRGRRPRPPRSGTPGPPPPGRNPRPPPRGSPPAPRAGPPLEGLEHRGHEVAREGDGQAVQGLILAVEEGRGVGPDVVLVAEGEGVAGPDGLLLPDRAVLHARGEGYGVAGGLGAVGARAVLAEAHRHHAVGEQLALHHRVHAVGGGDDVEAAALEQLLGDLLRDLLVQPRLARGVLEGRNADLLDRRVRDGALPHQRVSATAEGEDRGRRGGAPAGGDQRTTTLTSRPGTSTNLAMGRPARCSRTRGSSRAARRTSSSEASRATSTWPRTLPFTCTASSTASSAAAASSATGQGWSTRPSA